MGHIAHLSNIGFYGVKYEIHVSGQCSSYSNIRIDFVLKKKIKEQGTLLAKKCRVLKSNDTYHFQKPRINKTQWYMIYSYNFSVSMIHFTLNTAPF